MSIQIHHQTHDNIIYSNTRLMCTAVRKKTLSQDEVMSNSEKIKPVALSIAKINES